MRLMPWRLGVTFKHHFKDGYDRQKAEVTATEYLQRLGFRETLRDLIDGRLNYMHVRATHYVN